MAGPSGCGKSTLIRAINGLDSALVPRSAERQRARRRPTDGRDAAARASDAGRHACCRTRASSSSPRPCAASWHSAPRTWQSRRPTSIGSSGSWRRGRGIEHLSDRTTDELSGGESQQIAIAGALMLEPRVVVLDEPLANLDPMAAAAPPAPRARTGRGRHRGRHGRAPGRGRAGGRPGPGPVPRRRRAALPRSARRLLRGRRPGGGQAAVRRGPDAREGAPADPIAGARGSRHGAAPVDGAPPRIRMARRPGRLRRPDRAPRGEHGTRTHERVAVLGPNGSGKTTLFKAAIGLVPRTAGDVLVDGTSIAGRSVAELARTFGYVFQNPSPDAVRAHGPRRAAVRATQHGPRRGRLRGAGGHRAAPRRASTASPTSWIGRR